MIKTNSMLSSKLTVTTKDSTPLSRNTSCCSTRASSRASRAGSSAAKSKRKPTSEIDQLREENSSLKDQVEEQERIIEDLKLKCQRHETQNSLLMEEIGAITKKLMAHEDFQLPMRLDESKLVVTNKREGVDDDLVKFSKEVICRALAESDKIYDAADTIGNKVSEEQGGLWFCSIVPVSSISQFAVFHKDENTLSLGFERNGAHYLISIIQTCHEGCYNEFKRSQIRNFDHSRYYHPR